MRFQLQTRDATVSVVFNDGGMNLLSTEALHELAALVERVRAERGTDTFVLRSGRPGLFAAGADMAEMSRFEPAGATEFSRLGQSVFARIASLPQLSIVFIEGDCFGGALDLSLAFDVRVAASSARFAHPGSRIGMVTGFGGTSRWRNVLTRPAARSLFVGGAVLTAEEAWRCGLVDRIEERGFETQLRCSQNGVAVVKMLTQMGIATRSGLLGIARSWHPSSAASRLG